jgi:putative ABC transport system permease protein
MLTAITRKVIADVRSRPLQSALLVLVVGLAAGAMTTSLALREASSRPYENLMEDSNGAHVWLYSGNRADLDAVAEREEVIGVAGPFARHGVELDRGGGEVVPLTFWGMDAERPEVARPVLTSGRWLEADGEAVLEAGLARDLELRPGDTFEVAGQRLEVVGAALTSATLPYPEYDPGNVFVLDSTMQALSPTGTDWEVGLQIENPEASGDFIASALREVDRASEIRAQTWQSLRSDSADAMEVQVIFFTVFSVFAMVAVALIIANVVSSAVLSQYHEVGILKAIGFGRRHVAAVFLGAQAGLALLAAIVGTIAGFLIAPLFVTDLGGVLSASRLPVFDPGIALVVIGVTVGIAAALAALPAWAGGRVPAVRAIAGNRGTGGGVSRTSRVASALRLPAVVRIGVKDVFVRPVRTWLTILAMAVTVATAAMTLSIEETFSRAEDDPTPFANEAYHLEIAGGDPSRALEAARSTDGIAAVATQWGFQAELPGRPRTILLRALGGDADAVLPPLKGGRSLQGLGEALITERLAGELGVEIGDTLTPSVFYFTGPGIESRELLGETQLEIVGLYADADDEGQQAYTLASTFDGKDLGGALPIVGIRVADIQESDAVKAALVAELGPGFEVIDELSAARDDISSAVSAARPALLGLTGLLVVIAVANVLSTLLFAMRERYREVGVLKAVGFAPSDIAWATAIGAMVLAGVAVVIGIPAGLWITESLFDHFGAEEGWTPGVAATPPAWQLALLVPASLAVAVAGALLPARRAASISAADALRFE